MKLTFEIDNDKYEKVITFMAISGYDLEDIFLLGAHVLGIAIQSSVGFALVNEIAKDKSILVGSEVVFNLTVEEIAERIREYKQ